MIPKLTHQIWIKGTPIPGQYLEWRERLIGFNLDWEHVLHEVDPLENVKPQYVANAARMEFLWREGGLYLDMDVEPFQPLSSLSLNPDAVSCDWFMKGPHYAVVSAPPGHPALAYLAAAFTRKVKDWQAGPYPSFLFEMRRYHNKHLDEFERMGGVESATDPSRPETVLYHHLYSSRRVEMTKER